MADVEEPVVVVQADGPIRVVKLNRPDQLNSINEELDNRLATIFSELAEDVSARVIVQRVQEEPSQPVAISTT